MAEDPEFILSYDGGEYPVALLTQPTEQVTRVVFELEPLGVDPFAAGYDGSGFTIAEYLGGVPTGLLTVRGVEGNSVDQMVFPNYPVYYVVNCYGVFTPYFDGVAPCFAGDTLIATPDGPVPVQDLVPGDVVSTTTGTGPVVWLGHRRAQGCDVVRVRRGTLGAAADLIVSDDHALFVDGVLVPAGLLVDGAGVVRERRDAVTLYHVELERHAILLAEGVAAESYIDTGNRRQFGNCPIGYDPVRATQDPCAEMVLAGERLDRIRTLLAGERATAEDVPA